MLTTSDKSYDNILSFYKGNQKMVVLGRSLSINNTMLINYDMK